MWFRKTHKRLQLNFPWQYIRSLNWRVTMVFEFLAMEVIHYRICHSAQQTRQKKKKLVKLTLEATLIVITLNAQFEQII